MRRVVWAGLLASCVVFEPDTTAGVTGDATSGEAGPGESGLAGATTGPADPTTTSVPTSGEADASSAGGSSEVGGSSEGPGDTGDATTAADPAPLVSEVWAYDAFDLGDVDGDGRVDLVAASTGQPPRVTVYAGLGDGRFVGPDGAVETQIPGFLMLVVADATGDGRADVLAQGTGQPPRVTVHAGRADLGFDELATTEVFTFTHMHAADMDADGRADLLTGKGDGDPPQVLVWPGTDAGIADAPLSVAMVWQYAALRGGDVDGDGLADVVTADPGPTPRRFDHAGDGLGGLGGPVATDIFTFSRIDLGDVDGDGRADLVTDVPNNPWRFQLYRSAHGELMVPAVLEGFNSLAFELGDVDGDGLADLVAMPTGSPPRVEVYLAPFGL